VWAPFEWFSAALRALKWVVTGETLYREDTYFAGGLFLISLRLKRETRSRKEYVVFVGASGGTWYDALDMEAFDRFIEAADEVRGAQSCAIATSPYPIPKLGHLTDMILKGGASAHRYKCGILHNLISAERGPQDTA
jgi:hypothetical protein